MERQKWGGQDSGLADLQEKINAASCGEEQTGDCPGPRKETTDGPHVTQGVRGGGGACSRTADNRRRRGGYQPPPLDPDLWWEKMKFTKGN